MIKKNGEIVTEMFNYNCVVQTVEKAVNNLVFNLAIKECVGGSLKDFERYSIMFWLVREQ